MNELLPVLILWGILALPSVAHGVVMALRAGKSVPFAFVACLLLPWVGLLFFLGGPAGRRRVTGLGQYCAHMFVVAACLAIWSIVPAWVVGDPNVLGGDGMVGPTDVWPLAVVAVVWAVCLVGGATAVLRGADLTAGVLIGLVTSVALGVLLALRQAWGTAGLLVPELRDAQTAAVDVARVGPGGWVAFVALVVAYLCATLLPFGLRLEPLPVPAPPAPLGGQPVGSGAWNGGQPVGSGAWNGGQPVGPSATTPPPQPGIQQSPAQGGRRGAGW